MTKEQLEQYLIYKNEYIIAKDVYEYLLASKPSVMNLGKVKGSDSEYPYCERSFTIDGVDEKEMARFENKINIAKADMLAKKTVYENAKIDVDIFILKIPNARHREILKMIYVDDLKKVDVAKRCHYSQPRISQIINEYTEK